MTSRIAVLGKAARLVNGCVLATTDLCFTNSTITDGYRLSRSARDRGHRMAWVRVEDAISGHPKHLRAGPAACWFWICGIAYCQRQLSDGFIPDAALPLVGVARGFKALAAVLVTVGLFERVNGGYLVHDYHDYNDTREQALTIKAARAEQRRQAGLASGRARSSAVERNSNGAVHGSLNPVPSRPVPDRIGSKKRASHVEPPRKPADSRIAEFLKWFPEEYKARRNGAEYLVKHGKHGALVKQMLGATDLEKLKKYAQILLNEKTDDEFIAGTDRGIEILSARFSWLSDRLAAWETRQRTVPA